MPEGRPRGRRGHGGNDRGSRRRTPSTPNELRPPFPVEELMPEEAPEGVDLPAETDEAAPAAEGTAGSVDLNSLYKMGNPQIADAAKRLGIEGATSMRKQDLIFEIMKAQSEQSGLVFAEGVLQVLQDGYGFLRHPDYNYLPGPDDIYISPSQIKRFGLVTGDTVSGQVRPPKEDENYFALIKVLAVNFDDPERLRDRIFFDNLTPLYPQEKIRLEIGPDAIA